MLDLYLKHARDMPRVLESIPSDKVLKYNIYLKHGVMLLCLLCPVRHVKILRYKVKRHNIL